MWRTWNPRWFRRSRSNKQLCTWQQINYRRKLARCSVSSCEVQVEEVLVCLNGKSVIKMEMKLSIRVKMEIRGKLGNDKCKSLRNRGKVWNGERKFVGPIYMEITFYYSQFQFLFSIPMIQTGPYFYKTVYIPSLFF